MKSFCRVVVVVAVFCGFMVAQNRNVPHQGHDRDADDSTRLIEGPRVINLSTHSATIEWKTNKNGANHIRYGSTPGRFDKTKYVPGGSKEHQMTLTGLQPNTTYYFEIMERDGEARQGGTGSFRTPGGPSTHAQNSPWGKPSPRH